MKIILSLVVSLSAFAASATDISNQATGLRCTMDYSSGAALSTFRDTNTSWMISGSEMAGTAVVSDGDGIAGTSAANYIEVGTTKINGETFWKVTVLNSEKSTVGVLLFPETSGIKGTFEVNAVYNDSEDPPVFDTLEVTCEFTAFAG